MKFKTWERAVDYALRQRFMFGLADMIDAPTRDMFDAGTSPAEAAYEVASRDETFAAHLEEYGWEIDSFQASVDEFMAEESDDD
jgi:hypothetical protein